MALDPKKTHIWHDDALGVKILRARYTGQSFSKHVHQGYCIGLVETGAHGFYCKGANHVGPPGSIILVNADEVHTGHNAREYTKDVLWCYHAMYPDPEKIRWALEYDNDDKVNLPWFVDPVAKDPVSARLLANLFRSFAMGESILSRQCQFVTLVAQLADRFSRSRHEKNVGNENIKINYVKEQLLDRLVDDISLSELAEGIGWSPSYLNRVFKKVIGLPPHAFQIQKRVEKAREYLEAGLNVSDAALSSGFADQSHLHRHFIKTVGVTPGSYRIACK
jgi:AraC-like DNA-binding protein